MGFWERKDGTYCFTFASLLVDHGRRKLKRLRDRIGDGGDSNFQVEKELTREENLFASLAKESQNYVSIPHTFYD